MGCLFAEQTVELSGVGCDDREYGQRVEDSRAARDAVEGVGVDDYRRFGLLDEGFHGIDGDFRGAEARAYGVSIVGMVCAHLRYHQLVIVGLEHRFGDGGLGYGIEALWRVEGHLAGAGADGSGGGEDGCASHLSMA